MEISVEYIPEPHLEFGGHFLHPDKKTGLAQHGPFGRTHAALHPAQIKVGIVGTRATAELCERMLAAAKAEVAQEVSRVKEDLREQVAALAIAGAEKILRREIDAKVHAQMLAQLKQEL